MQVRWTHITISTNNLEGTIEFYRSFCGFSVVRDRRQEGGGTVWLGMEPPPGENPIFVLVISEGEVTSQTDHLGFQCESREQVERIAERAKELRILLSSPKDSGGSVGYWCQLADPDGHVLEFTYGQPIEGF